MRIGLRELIFFLLLLGMPVAAWFYVYKPHNEQIAQARQEIRNKQQKLHELEQATMRIDDLGEEIDKLTEVIKQFELRLPEEKEVEVVLKEVWETASQRGLNPRSVRTDKPIKSDRYTELPIKMIIVGDFDGFYEFMLDVERMSRITRIPEMKLKKLATAEGEMEATFTLSIFFEPAGPKQVAAGL